MASSSVDLGSISSLHDFVFHAFDREWVFYNSGFKTSADAGLTWSLKQPVPLNSWQLVAMTYHKETNRIYIVETHGQASSAPVGYIWGIPDDNGNVTWGEPQYMWKYSGNLYDDKRVSQVVCDSNGCPWIQFKTYTAFGNVFKSIAKSSTVEVFTDQWIIRADNYYPGSPSSPNFTIGVLIPDASGGMRLVYTHSRINAWQKYIDEDRPVLFYRTFSRSGAVTDPPDKIQGYISHAPAAGLRVGADYHVVLREQNTNSILHVVNTIVKQVEPLFLIPNLTHDIQRNRLMCFWTQNDHIYYKTYDLATGLWDLSTVDWLDESFYGGISSAWVQINPLNDFEYKRFPVAYSSQSYVRFALSNLQPPVVRTLPATLP